MMLRPLALLCAFVLLARADSCGSLITYRQYDVLLSAAPACFANGCGQDPQGVSMSSTCNVSEPCSHLWEFLRQQWQPDWCPACNSDIACRIAGWPVLNMTAACAVQPNEWLFANTGACCVSNDEPFQLSDWIGGLCNGSVWRVPFEYYGGMAKEDWEEWIEPWNWTVRPQNTSTQIVSEPSCSAPSTTLWSFGIENFSNSGQVLIETFLFWMAVNIGKTQAWINIRGIPEERTAFWAIVSGIWYPIAHWLVSSFWITAEWRASPGYQDTPVGFLVLLLCSRPSVLMLLICIMLCIDRQIDDDYHLQLHLRRVDLSDINRLGRARAKHLIASFGLSISISEIITQILGYYSILKTTDTGVKRSFFIAGNLVPFWRGSPAMRMYGGALVHSIFAPITAPCLYLSAYAHTRESKFHKEWYDWLSFLFGPVNEHFAAERRRREEERRAQEARDARATENRARSDEQRQDPATEGIEQAVATSSVPDPEKSAEETEEAGEKHQVVKMGWLLATFSTLVLGRRVVEGDDDGLAAHAAPASADLPSGEDSGSERPVGRLLGLPVHAEEPDEERHEAAAEADRRSSSDHTEEVEFEHFGYYSVVVVFYTWLIRGVPEDMRNRFPDLREEAQRRYGPPEDYRPEWAKIILVLTTICATVNFVAQWCFWSGFVESQGPRFCPPDDNDLVLKVRLILSLLPLAGLLPNFVFAALEAINV